MGIKLLPVDVMHKSPITKSAAVAKVEMITSGRRSPRSGRLGLKIVAALGLILSAAGLYLAYGKYRVGRLAHTVRQAFASRQIDEARDDLDRWLAIEPGSGEAHYFRAWGAMAHDRPGDAFQAIDRARTLGFDRALLDCLSAIGQSRSGRFGEAEPILEQAFRNHVAPEDMVAGELARIYLSTFRLDQAARAIEVWRTLAPEDPQPYMWSNEILSRSDSEPAAAIQNFRAALKRDPNLDKARLGLAQQLSKARRFDEADHEFLAYLERKPSDATALLGLGRNAFQQGDIDSARRNFEEALKTNPREADALKEISQIDLRQGRYQEACDGLALLVQIDPFDHEIRYNYGQALKLAGFADRSNAEIANAARLRREHDEIVQLRSGLLQDQNNVAVRFKITQWLFDHGHQDEGLKWTREILRADPRHAPTHRLLAAFYAKQGDAGLANYHRVMASAGQEDVGETESRGAAPSLRRTEH